MMSDQEKRNYVAGAMSALRGDDLERANMAFGKMSSKELDQQWGASGKTCRQIWQEYEDHAERHGEVWAWLREKGVL